MARGPVAPGRGPGAVHALAGVAGVAAGAELQLATLMRTAAASLRAAEAGADPVVVAS